MLVREVMSCDVVSISGDRTAAEAAQLMSKHNIGVLPVTDGNCVKGIVTDRDIVLRCVAKGMDSTSCKVCDVMSCNTTFVSPDQSVSDAARIMACEQIRRIPVLEGGNLAGMITLGDISRYKQDAEVAQAMCEISKP